VATEDISAEREKAVFFTQASLLPSDLLTFCFFELRRRKTQRPSREKPIHQVSMSQDRTSLLGKIVSASYGAAAATTSEKPHEADIETSLVGHRGTFSKHDSNMLAGSLTNGSLTAESSIPVKPSVSDTAPDRKRSEPIARTPQQVHKKGGESTYLFVVL
jgi:hypothetical protein